VSGEYRRGPTEHSTPTVIVQTLWTIGFDCPHLLHNPFLPMLSAVYFRL